MLDITYKLRFMEIWKSAMREGYSSSDARDLASLELTGQLFSNYDSNNDNQRNRDKDSGGIDSTTEPVSA